MRKYPVRNHLKKQTHLCGRLIVSEHVIQVHSVSPRWELDWRAADVAMHGAVHGGIAASSSW
jgi:hypothetical protein